MTGKRKEKRADAGLGGEALQLRATGRCQKLREAGLGAARVGNASPCRARRGERVTGLFNRSVTALTAAELFDRGEKIFFCEIRPESRRHVHFRVGELPKEEVRQAHLARSANEQIGIGIVSRVQMFTEHFDVDHCFVDVTELDCAEQTFDSVDDLQPSPVTERENQRKPVVGCSCFDRFV